MRFAPAICLAILLTATVAAAEQTISCPAGQIDMLDWMTLDSDLRTNHHMTGDLVLHTSVWPDKFYWIKNNAGDTWDIMLYNNSYIYQWITEYGWNQPQNYKRAATNYNFPMVPRCATPGATTTLLSNTNYTIYLSCQAQQTLSLGKALMELWGPYTAGHPGLEGSRQRIGGDIADNTPVYVIAYLWDCDNNYSNCGTKEEFTLAQRYGLVRWNAWQLVNGQYTADGQTTFNRLVSGAVAPYFPCF